MKKIVCPLLLLSICFALKSVAQGKDVTKKWKLGVAFWTFHNYPATGIVDRIDSTGVDYAEGMTSMKAGPQFGDSALNQLSQAGVDKFKKILESKGLKMESMYGGGGHSIESWKSEFEVAKRFNLKYITGEPPIDMWDSIDSLAGVYHIKVAIHEHWKGMSAYWNPDTVLIALKGHPNFGVCADLGHWPKSGINPLDAVKKLAGHILIVHMKDIAAYNDPKLVDVPAGTGIVDFPAIFAELKKQGFTGYIYIERDAQDQPNNLPSVIQTVKYYNTLVNNL